MELYLYNTIGFCYSDAAFFRACIASSSSYCTAAFRATTCTAGCAVAGAVVSSSASCCLDNFVGTTAYHPHQLVFKTFISVKKPSQLCYGSVI